MELLHGIGHGKHEETTIATYNREGTDKTTHALPVLCKFQLHGGELTYTFQ